MISRSCQDSRLHTDPFRSSKGSRMSTDPRITTYGKPDGKKCAFECWLPDNCSQTAVKFRSVAGISPALSDMKSKRNRIQPCRFLMDSIKGDVGKWDANGTNTGNLTTCAQSVKRVMRSAGCGCPSIQTRFSVQSRSYSSRPLKTISSRTSSSSSSHSYCTVVDRDMHKNLTMESTKYEATKPAARFSLFRANCRRGTGQLRPDVDVWCSTLPYQCSRQAANCAELQFNLHDRGCSSVDTVPVGSESTVNIQEAIAHIATEFQTGNNVGEEIGMLKSAALLPEEHHVLKAEHTHQTHSDAERCWNKLWNNIPPSGVEENQSMVKLRQMAGKLIESLICKIKLHLDSGTQPRTVEHECAMTEKEEHKPRAVNEHQQCSHGTKEHAVQSKCTTNDYEELRDDASESKHLSCQAIEKRVAKEQSSKADDQRNTLVNQIDMQSIICRSANQQDNTEQDTCQELHNPSEIQTTMAKSDRNSLSQRKSDDKMNLRSGSRPYKQENCTKSAQGRTNGDDNSIPNINQNKTDVSLDSDQNKSHGNLSDEIKSNKTDDNERDITSAKDDEIREASSSESGHSVTANNAADDEEGGEDNEEEDEDEEGIENDKVQSTNEKAKSSDIRVEGQQQVKGDQTLLLLRNNDYVEKTEAVKYRSVRPQPSSHPSASEPSATSIRKEHELQSRAENNSQTVKASVGNDGVNKKDSEAATRSQSIIFSNREDLEETIEQATMDPEAEATLKSFASEVVQSLYTAIRYKLKNLVQDGKDEAKKLEIMQKGDTELKDQILPTIIEHIVWIIKEEFRGQDESEWKDAMMHDPGQYLDTIVTNAVMKTHTDHMAQRAFLKTFVVTSNFKHSAKWKL